MRNYSIGLDIGTTSVGWAVVDDNDELVRYKRKNMWGSRLFDEADKAESTRSFRTSRRRTDRREQRINFLQRILSPMVLSADESFFIKLNESMLCAEDKKLDPLKNSLEKAGYYQRKNGKLIYPTIYHLRKELMESKDKFDPRLVYLAIHHIIKYRGNFLYEGQNFDINSTKDIEENLTQVFWQLEDITGLSAADFIGKKMEIISVLKQNNKSRSGRQSDILSIFNLDKEQKAVFRQVVGAFVGLTINLNKIFRDLEDKKFEFSKFEEKRESDDEIFKDLNDEQMDFLELLQKVYSWTVLQGVLRGQDSVSQAMIRKYNDYALDLKFAKDLFKKYLSKDDYKEYFKSKRDAKGQFSHYTRYTESGWNYDDFIKDFKKYFDKAKRAGADLTSKDAKRFIERLENKEAFAKLRTSDNGAIPYQLHEKELIKIIENQGRFYPELLEEVDNGDKKMKYKLIRLIEHRIPYYVGPLQTPNQDNSRFAWMKRQEDGDITPFNFYKKVDTIASAEAFIERLTNNCTYLPAETVLPKHSLLFSEFTVRNEIKNMRIDGEHPSIDVENDLVKYLFSKKRKVTKKDIVSHLRCHQYVTIKSGAPLEISGLASTAHFNSTLSSYIDLTEKIGLEINLQDVYSPEYAMAEDLIKWVTIFEDKSILKEKIRLEYGDKLTDEQISLICKLNYSGWASLSRKLLVGITDQVDDSTGENIIDIMRSSEDNFMQIISDFRRAIKQKIQAELDKFISDYENGYEQIDRLPTSPGIKRGIWQAVQLVDEIIQLEGGRKPEKIYIEMARGSDGSGRTQSRKRQIEKVYDKIELNSEHYNKDELAKVKKELAEIKNIDRDALVLYFQQLGKCAYSGQRIDLSKITQTCQIDHILPQSLIKDNSLDNRVLVIASENQHKRETYPIEPEIVKRQIGLWKYWRDNNLISAAKFARLSKTKEKYDDEKASGGFIARQLVETRQITKHVAALFNQKYQTNDETPIVEPVKARISSEFRDKFNLPKSRSINDFHHAKDAYLAVVLGRFLAKKFNDRSRSNLYNRYMKFSEETRESRGAKETGFVLWGIDKEIVVEATGEILDGKQRIKTIQRTMRFNDCLVTKKLAEQKSGFYKINLVNETVAQAPRADGLSLKYGGYTGIEKAFCVAVRYAEKNKQKSTIIGIPVADAYKIKAGHANLFEIVKGRLGEGATDIRVVRDKILKYQVIDKDGALVRMLSDKEVANAKQLKLSPKQSLVFAHLEKMLASNSYSSKAINKLNSLSGLTLNAEDKQDCDKKIALLLDEIFNSYVEKMQQEYKLYAAEVRNIINKEPDFKKLANIDKVRNLSELFKLNMEKSTTKAFTKDFDLGNRFGRKTGQTFDLDKITFYDYSITGLKIKKTKL